MIDENQCRTDHISMERDLRDKMGMKNIRIFVSFKIRGCEIGYKREDQYLPPSKSNTSRFYIDLRPRACGSKNWITDWVVWAGILKENCLTA
jgi:hypothetical protein